MLNTVRILLPEPSTLTNNSGYVYNCRKSPVHIDSHKRQSQAASTARQPDCRLVDPGLSRRWPRPALHTAVFHGRFMHPALAAPLAPGIARLQARGCQTREALLLCPVVFI
jgi:hypothetical protein